MLNKVLPIGYAGAQSEMKFTAAGIPVANFSLAVKEVYKNGDGEKKTNTIWIRCVAWRRWAEIAGEFVTKGKFLSKAFDKNFYHQQLFIERNASQISN
jgi:single-strand DNA-binding protein